MDGPLRSLAAKLDYLFRHVHRRDGGEYSYRQVAGGIERAGGPTISPTYVMYLRKGERTNPTVQHLEAIATFFGVPLAYFLDDETTDRVARELELFAAFRDSGVRDLARRASDLSPEGLAAVTHMLDEVRRAEGKDSPGHSSSRGRHRHGDAPDESP
jgi:transcriptional regulator with XRE-family HTH domain